MQTHTAREYALEQDAQDPLAHFRERFYSADPTLIYLDGNSLGRLPLSTIERSEALIKGQWGDRLIRSWNEGWFTMPEQVGAKIAGLIGAQPDEVIVADSTSVNLFKLGVAALQAQKGRRRILTDNLNFPSDLYILQGIIDLLKQEHRLEIIASEDTIYGPTEKLKQALDDQVALLTLSHTVFKSGYVYDIREMTAAAHDKGAMVLWDLSHSVGSVPVDLNASGADLAVGCTYKYLNGGPGSPAFIYVRKDLQQQLSNPISGWMGQRQLFNFDLAYQPTEGIRRFVTGTPAIASLQMIEAGVDVLLEAGMKALRSKSIQQSEFMIALWKAWLEPLGFSLNSPREATTRGSHISIGHSEGWRINKALIEDMNVIPDFRAPDNIRLGITPLYTSFLDIYEAMHRIKRIMEEQHYLKYQLDNKAVVT